MKLDRTQLWDLRLLKTNSKVYVMSLTPLCFDVCSHREGG